jgi:hypothetical protein
MVLWLLYVCVVAADEGAGLGKISDGAADEGVPAYAAVPSDTAKTVNAVIILFIECPLSIDTTRIRCLETTVQMVL